MLAALKNRNVRNFDKLIISTGDILTVKLGRKSSEELLESLQLTLFEFDNDKENCVNNSKSLGKIMRQTAELKAKLKENQRQKIIVGAKIFLNNNKSNNNADYIKTAVENMLDILNLEHVDHVILAYQTKSHENCSATSKRTRTRTSTSAIRNDDVNVKQLLELWATMEDYALEQKIQQLGVADLDVASLKQLYAAARVKPNIAQINLSSSCIVPTELQEFCAEHDIRLLTHSDPDALLPTNEQFIVPDFEPDWTLRYQVHIHSRGLLTAKGFLVGASKIKNNCV